MKLNNFEYEEQLTCQQVYSALNAVNKNVKDICLEDKANKVLLQFK